MLTRMAPGGIRRPHPFVLLGGLFAVLVAAPIALGHLSSGPVLNGRIAFASNRDGNFEVYSMLPDGTDLRRLTNTPATECCPDWSPDGSKVAFVSYRDGNNEIYVADADGGNPTRLTFDPAWDADPDWSPDGQMLAFGSNRDGNGEIYVMNPDGSGVDQLTDDPVGSGSPVLVS